MMITIFRVNVWLLAFIYIFTIYGLYTWGPLVLHTPASAHGAEVDNLMNITWI
jgi:cytochrome c oxidase subunit 2